MKERVKEREREKQERDRERETLAAVRSSWQGPVFSVIDD